MKKHNNEYKLEIKRQMLEEHIAESIGGHHDVFLTDDKWIVVKESMDYNIRQVIEEAIADCKAELAWIQDTNMSYRN